jgi:regulator of replication initiation timing
MTDGNTLKRIEWAGWAGVLLTALSALLAITVQWGVVNTKLDNVEKRLDEMIFEARALRSEYQSIERRLSNLEGQHRAEAKSSGGNGKS